MKHNNTQARLRATHTNNIQVIFLLHPQQTWVGGLTPQKFYIIFEMYKGVFVGVVLWKSGKSKMKYWG